MAFPTIPTAAAGRVLTGYQADTTGTRTFPSLTGLTKNAGDLLIAICIAYQSSTTDAQFSGWTGGFTEFHDSGSGTTMAIGAAYKFSTGSETGTFAVTQAATITGHACFILLSISGAHASSLPEAGSRASGTSAAADPAAFNPSWAAEDILWIAVGGAGEVSTTSTWTGLASAPTNYTDYAETGLGGQDVAGAVEGAVGFRQLNADSTDVGPFGVDITNARNAALVIAVRPPPAPVEIDGDLAVTVGSTDTAQAIHPVDGTLALTATLSGTAVPEHTVAGDLPLTATLTGDATVTGGVTDVDVDGSLAVTVGLTSTEQAIHPVAGDLAVTTTLTGTAVPVHTLDGTLALSVGLTSTSAATHPIDGNLSVTAGLTGDATVVQPGQVNVDGDLAGIVLVAGMAALELPTSGDLAVTATLTGTADIPPPGAVVDVDGDLAVTVTFTSEPPISLWPVLVAQTQPLLAVATTKRGALSATAPRRSA